MSLPATAPALAAQSARPPRDAVPSRTLYALDALGERGTYRARRRRTVTDATGQELAELSLVPPLFIHRTMVALRRAEPPEADERAALLHSAARLFATGEVAGLSPAAYEEAASRAGGIPVSIVRRATATTAERLRRAYESVQYARPAGTVNSWQDPLTRTGRGTWTRRGEVLAVHAAGNHPSTHSIWPEALALGYRVAVRPSRREPFTPHRLVSALRAAGFGDDQVALLPTEHQHADALRRGADLSLVYGGAGVVEQYAGDSAVRVQGPGRSKILITADTDWRAHLDTLVDSVSGHGGTGCVNTTAVFVEGDAGELAAALAERLAVLPSLPPCDDRAVLPVQPAATARAVAAHLLRTAAGTRAWLGGEGVADELGDGSAVLRPAVHQLPRADAPQAAVELPFPCVWVAPWRRADGVAPLRDSLVLAAITRDEELVGRLVAEPSISNVFVGGGHPTHLKEHGLPHDGYLSDFLMRSKSVIRN
ncbi:aldehyde dehydrogenase family protein [Streptomyces cuspidosporus]|uniref:Aldehyde dehydrogenase family protein n=1 Tax=Streptomyces cuspidosporus TaxID=66882 RepID=A0ABN3FIF2_9ACTN